MTKEQIEALRIIKNDLLFIKAQWNATIDDDSLRRHSPCLRQLLVDDGGLISKAEQWLNFKVYIKAPHNPLEEINASKISYFTAGGGNYNGVMIESMYMGFFETSPDEIKKNASNINKKHVKYTLKDFLNAPCIISEGEVFNRIELIKFVSNKLGGTHYELETKNMARKRFLMKVNDTTIVANKNAIYFEFLSIGQLLVKSKYIDRLIKLINSHL